VGGRGAATLACNFAACSCIAAVCILFVWRSSRSSNFNAAFRAAVFLGATQAVLPAFREERALIPGVRPQRLRAMLVGGGPPRPLIIFSSVRPSDGSPVHAILDIASATTAAAAADDGGGGDGDHGSRVSRTGLKEVELATRCCSKGVFSASPQAVFVNPAELKAFVSGGVPGGDGEGVVPVPRQGLLFGVGFPRTYIPVEESSSG